MAMEPFPSSALEVNRQLRLTAEQIRDLHADAVESKRSLNMAGFWVIAVGLFIIAGTAMGRAKGSPIQSYLLGGAIVGVGALVLSPRAKNSGVTGSAIASESTVLDRVEGAIRREMFDKQPGMDLLGATRNIRGDARYDFLLHVGERRFDVGRPAYEAAPGEGLVCVYLLPGTDRIVNLERLGDAPPSAIETRAREILEQRFGSVSEQEHQAILAHAPQSADELRAMLIGRWQADGIPMTMEFHQDGTVGNGRSGEHKAFDVPDATHVNIGGQTQTVETDGTTLLFGTRGPTLRFHRVPDHSGGDA
jgi:hypothetical protein